MIGKNIAGILLVALGIVLSLPGVPGQGLLTVLLGIMLLDFPGRDRLEQKLLSKPSIVNTINKLRGRFGKEPLVLIRIGECVNESSFRQDYRIYKIDRISRLIGV